MILLEATLSFLGLGVQPPTPTWGGMINDGRKYIYQSWAVSLFPGIAIALVIWHSISRGTTCATLSTRS